MKVLMLGGTGVIGSYLTKKLIISGADVFITSRSAHPSKERTHYIQGNAMEDAFLAEVVNLYKWDAIVDFMTYNTSKFRQRVKILLMSTTQYIYISSARVYGNLEHPIKESSPRLLDYVEDNDYLKTDEYALTKARQENILNSSGYSNYTIIRPCITYGEERLQLGVLEKEEWLYRAIHGRTVVLCKEIMESITTMTLGLDVCNAIFKTIGNPDCIGQTYHLTSSHHRSWNQILNIYQDVFREVLGKELKIKYVDLDSFIGCRLQIQKYQIIYDRIWNRDYDTTKESTLIDVDPFVTPEEGLRQCLISFLTGQRRFRSINPVFEANKDKLTDERTSISEFSGIKNKLKYVLVRYFNLNKFKI